MIEKRFTHKKWLDDRQLFDGDEPFAIVDVYIQAEAICNKLNELAEEKDYFERKKEYFLSKWSIANAKNIQLRQENKELKRNRNYWKTLAQSLAKNNGNVKLKDEHLAWKRVDVE